MELALRACKMKMIMQKLLYGFDNSSTLSEIAEICLEIGQEERAINFSEKGLSRLNALHAEAVKFFCIQMRAYYAMDTMDSVTKGDIAFNRALSSLGHHWGVYHPLHSTIYGIMAYLLIQSGKLE
jgi:hypothetical protein